MWDPNICDPIIGVHTYTGETPHQLLANMQAGTGAPPGQQAVNLAQSQLAASRPSRAPERLSGFDFFETKEQAASGNIFARRRDLNGFAGTANPARGGLARPRLNAYSIRLEDDGPQGDDETKTFVLTNLTAYRATSVRCLVCAEQLTVFDRYPLIDGTFFLSPIDHTEPADPCEPLSPLGREADPSGSGSKWPGDGVVAFPVTYENRPMYLNALCMWCLQGTETSVLCAHCAAAWDGSVLMLGSMYSFDVFASRVCCDARLACANRQCGRAVVDASTLTSLAGSGGGSGSAFRYYSYLSRAVTCPHCGMEAHHFVKPLRTHFVFRPAAAALFG